MKQIVQILVLALWVSACSEASTQPAVATAQPGTEKPAVDAPKADAAETFGAKLEKPQAIALTAVLDSPDTFAEKAVTVEGVVRRACTQKGCWMEVAQSADPNVQGCRVTFKDYGFFVPLNSAGANVKVEGVVRVITVAKGEVAHLEAEGATFAKKFDDGTAREVRIVATGVEMTGRPRG